MMTAAGRAMFGMCAVMAEFGARSDTRARADGAAKRSRQRQATRPASRRAPDGQSPGAPRTRGHTARDCQEATLVACARVPGVEGNFRLKTSFTAVEPAAALSSAWMWEYRERKRLGKTGPRLEFALGTMFVQG
jgi:hypothetical protein